MGRTRTALRRAHRPPRGSTERSTTRLWPQMGPHTSEASSIGTGPSPADSPTSAVPPAAPTFRCPPWTGMSGSSFPTGAVVSTLEAPLPGWAAIRGAIWRTFRRTAPYRRGRQRPTVGCGRSSGTAPGCSLAASSPMWGDRCGMVSRPSMRQVGPCWPGMPECLTSVSTPWPSMGAHSMPAPTRCSSGASCTARCSSLTWPLACCRRGIRIPGA